ncbi:hypothetical protein ACFSKL_06435 [Belliella marina]|uniref:Uncharacterized protein n=1 Tax=Belliella marina TaxID=1644146 RepID=A0ABW4VKB3_9BACT
MNRELVLLRTFSLAMAGGMVLLASVAFKNNGNHHFEEINAERINIVEADGTVKMIITNVDKFPNGDTKINDRPTNADRKKRSGMIFFNEDGIECGGFIYDGALTENGHSAGLSLTFDQYDGDQVMQLLTTDAKQGDRRRVSSSLVFMDRPEHESQQKTMEIMAEVQALRKTDPAAARAKMQEYQEQGLAGGAPRVMLGKSGSQNNGLFLFDDQGMPRAMFYVDQANQAKLDFYDENGEVLFSFPPVEESK